MDPERVEGGGRCRRGGHLAVRSMGPQGGASSSRRDTPGDTRGDRSSFLPRVGERIGTLSRHRSPRVWRRRPCAHPRALRRSSALRSLEGLRWTAAGRGAAAAHGFSLRSHLRCLRSVGTRSGGFRQYPGRLTPTPLRRLGCGRNGCTARRARGRFTTGQCHCRTGISAATRSMNMSESHAEVAETAVRSNQFIVEEVLPSRWFDEITEIRIHSRRVIEQEARRRKKRYSLTENGKLVLAALDHAARGVTEVGSNKLAMGDRHELLARARRVLADPNLDGLLVSGDVLEELLILNHLERREFGASSLDRRILVGSMNRGGLAGAEYEMEDAFTALSARRLKELRCDGGKMLCRLDARDPASGRTLLACAE